ncbi:MAG: filamentous hemagglutinin family protein [Agitococcus sp.]|nr:filamentous hemagglutinin family protein [Agitococcus sp.]
MSHQPRLPKVRLSAQGCLRVAIVRALCVPMLAGSLWPIVSHAAPVGSAAWFAQAKAAQAQTAASTPRAGSLVAPVLGAVATPQQAQATAQRSMANLTKAMGAILQAQAAQRAAQQSGISNIVNGLGAGGLQANTNNAANCVNAASCLWQNADLPTQTQAKDALTGADNYTVTVKQTAKKAILSWDSFNVGAQTTLNFDQSQGTQKDGLNDWVALNRVSANASPSQIMGKIKADGSIYLINPNGIIFGAGSQVNVHSLIATSLPMYLSSSAKSLQVHNNEAYLKASNQLFLESGISSVGPATANGNLLGLGSGQTQTLADNSDAQGNLLLPSKIEIKSGATISTNKLGFSLIAAPEIHNAGTVSAVDGQIILAAGLGVALKNSADGSLLLNPVLTGSLTQIIDGVTKDATPATTSSNNSLLVNQGMVQGIRGDVRLLGASIKQDGIVAATTSVSQAGSITISAQDKQATDAIVARTGSLVLTGNSLTTILPDANGETTISTTAATQNFKTGSINLNGAAVTLEKNALVEAPSQKVTITAIAQNDGNIAPDAIRDGSIAGRVYIDEGAIVDVAGIANVELPIESTLVSIPRLGLNELADSPLQKDSPLYGAAVVINSSITGTRDDGIAWVGTPLANLTGYVQQVKRNIEQLLQNGGTITLAGNEVLTKSGSLLNLNSGYVSYLGGLLSTTRLVDANGRVVDIANANPNERYTGIAGRFVDRHDRANNSLVYTNHILGGDKSHSVYESGYIQGGNAGTLNVYGLTTALVSGDVSAVALSGRHQVAGNHLAQGGTVNFGAGTSEVLVKSVLPNPNLPDTRSLPSYVVVNHAQTLDEVIENFSKNSVISNNGRAVSDTTNLLHWTPVDASKLQQAGFANVNIIADDPVAIKPTQGGEVVVNEDAALTVQTGGSIKLSGSRVKVDGKLTATSGKIAITGTGRTYVVGSTTLPDNKNMVQVGDVTIGDKAVLDARGQWVNDTGRDADQITGSAYINGGSVSISTQQNATAITKITTHIKKTDTTTGLTTESTETTYNPFTPAIAGTKTETSTENNFAIVKTIITEINTPDLTGSINLAANSVIDVSSGGRVLPTGFVAQKNNVPLGKGGNISLLSYVPTLLSFGGNGTGVPQLPTDAPPANGKLNLQGALRGYGFNGGGTLSLRTLGLQIGGTQPVDAPWVMVLPENYFDKTGFGHIYLQAEYDAKISALTTLNLSQFSFLTNDFQKLAELPTATNLWTETTKANSALTIGQQDASRRQAVNLSIYAGDFATWSPQPDFSADGITGTMLVEKNAVINADAGAAIILGSMAQVTVDGAITAHGGIITLTGDTAKGGYSQVAGLIVNGNAPISDSKSVWLGENALLDVSGTTLIDPLATLANKPIHTGRVLDGGTVTLTNDTGYVVVQDCRDSGACAADTEASKVRAATINVSGTNAVLDLPFSGDSTTAKKVASDAGTIRIGAAKGLFFHGLMKGQAGSNSTEGGSLEITPLRGSFVTSVAFGGATAISLTKSLIPMPKGSEGEIIKAGDVDVLLESEASGVLNFATDSLSNTGITSLRLGVDPTLNSAQAPLPINFFRNVIKLDADGNEFTEVFSEDVTLNMGRKIVINASELRGPPTKAILGTKLTTILGADGEPIVEDRIDLTGKVDYITPEINIAIEAPYVNISGLQQGGNYPLFYSTDDLENPILTDVDSNPRMRISFAKDTNVIVDKLKEDDGEGLITTTVNVLVPTIDIASFDDALGLNYTVDSRLVDEDGLTLSRDDEYFTDLLPQFYKSKFSVKADAIDMGGQFLIDGFASASVVSSGDLRFVTPSSYDYLRDPTNLARVSTSPGLLQTTAELNLSAGQIYPATGNKFIVNAMGRYLNSISKVIDDPTDPESTFTYKQINELTGNSVNIRTTGKKSASPLSAGGSVIFNAANISQGGVVRAPDGQLILGANSATDSFAMTQLSYQAVSPVDLVSPLLIQIPVIATEKVELLAGSETSVSLDGATVPYGTTADSQNLQYNGSATSAAGAATAVPTLTSAPQKQLAINGQNIKLETGAVINLAGGGDLQAQEWIAGTGGSRNVLNAYNTSYATGTAQSVPLYADGRAVYAVIAGNQSKLAAYDPQLVADPLIGKAVYLSGTKDLPAGIYTLLPGRYATLPNAFRVVQDTNSNALDALSRFNTVMPDGTARVAGYFTDVFSGAKDARTTSFLVQSNKVWQQYSQFELTSLNNYFTSNNANGQAALPKDAGQLILSANTAMTLGAKIKGQAVAGGLGADINITAPKLQIADSDIPALAGYLKVDSKQLNDLGASRLVLGGISHGGKDADILQATATDVVIDAPRVGVHAPEIIAMARSYLPVPVNEDAPEPELQIGSVTVKSNTVLQATGGQDRVRTQAIQVGLLSDFDDNGNEFEGITGDGALLRLSSGKAVAIQRINVSGIDGDSNGDTPTGVLRIDNNVKLLADGAVTLDTVGNMVVAPTVQIKAKSFDANSADITFTNNLSTIDIPDGLVAGQSLLVQLAAIDDVALRSRGTIRFVGDLDLQVGKKLTLSSGSIRSDGGEVTIRTDQLILANELETSGDASLRGTGKLNLRVGELGLGFGDVILSGFSTLDVIAERGIVGKDTGSLTAGKADIHFHTPILSAETATNISLRTTGEVTIDKVGAGVAKVQTGTGGKLSINATSINVDSQITANAGAVQLVAGNGGLNLGSQAVVDVNGITKSFFDVERYAPAGNITLESTGALNVAPTASLNFAAANKGGDAGTLKLVANGALNLQGQLNGSAKTGQQGGSFTLLSTQAVDLNELADALAAGKVNGKVAVTTQQGNLQLGTGKTLQAQEISLVAKGGAGQNDSNNGNIIIDGTVNASGQKGGDIRLTGSSSVVINGSLLATASTSDQRGGNITIATQGTGDGSVNSNYGYQNINANNSGKISLNNSAIIDVHGGSAGGLANGTVHLRAPILLDGGLNVDVANANSFIGAREVAVEGFAIWNTNDNSTGNQHFDGIIDPLGIYGSDGKKLTTASNSNHNEFYGKTLAQFVQQSNVGFADQFTGINNLKALAGIELVNTNVGINNGDVTLASNWNLAAVDSSLKPLYRSLKGVAPKLTLKAANNINVNASLSDGFEQNNNPFSFNTNFLINGNRLSPTGTELLIASLAGGDSSSFDLQAEKGSIRFNKTLQTSDVFWLYQAPLERPRNENDSVIYTAQLANGQPLPTWLTFDPVTRTLSGMKDFATGSLSIKVIATHSLAAEEDPPVVTTATLKALATPTMVRTGTGSINMQAGQDIAILDDLAPAVIYSAGRPALNTPSGNAELVIAKDGLPLFINSGQVNPEAAGNISLDAGRDIIGIEKVVDSTGKLTGNKGTDLSQFWWTWMQNPCLVTVSGCNPQSNSSLNFGMFGQGVMSAGGDIAVQAGQDVKGLAVSLPVTWRLVPDSQGQQELAVFGGGDLALNVGRNLFGGSYFVANGQGNIRVNDNIIRSDALAQTLLAVQDGQLKVVAGGVLEIGGIYNPSWLFKGFDSNSYSSSSSVSLQSLTSAIVLGGERVTPGANYGFNPASEDDGTVLASAYNFVLPAHVNMEALNGTITIRNNAELYPSSNGQLSLLADSDITLVNPDINNSYMGLIDASPSLLPSVFNPILSGKELRSSFIGGVNSAFDLHSPIPLHLNDSEPMRIYSVNGSLINGSDNRNYNGAIIVAAAKVADIRAGLDVVNLAFSGQNLYASDITNIQAGRDLYNPPLVPNQSVPFIELGGIGTLNVQAGRNLGPLTSANEALAQGYLPKGSKAYPGIRTVGGLNNYYLSREGANISVNFGLAPAMKNYVATVERDTLPTIQIATDEFAEIYLNPAIAHDPSNAADKLGTPNYNQQLVAFVGQYQQDVLSRAGQSDKAELQQAAQTWTVLSATEQGKYAATAWSAFKNLASGQRQAFVGKVFLDVLNQVGNDYNNKNSPFKGQYARGYQAINTLFPASLGYTANSSSGGQNGADVLQKTGTFDMRGSTVQTQKGGDVSIIGPGGKVLVGSTSAPPQVAKSESSSGVGPNNQGILTLEAGKISLFSDDSILLAQSRIFTEQGGDILIWSSNGDVNAGKGAKTSTEVPPPEFLCDPDHFCQIDAKSQVSGAGIAVLQTKVGSPAGSANLIAPRGTVDAGEAGIRVAGSLNIAAFTVANADNIQVQGEATGVPSVGVDSGAMAAANSVSSAATQSAALASGGQKKREALASDFLFEYIGGDEESDCGDDNKDCKKAKKL